MNTLPPTVITLDVFPSAGVGVMSYVNKSGTDISSHTAPNKSPFRLMVTVGSFPKSTVPSNACWMLSVAKFVYRLYTDLKNVIWGVPVKYTS